MRRISLLLAVCSLLLSAAPSPAGIPYYPDRVPAATLIAPFFETGINVVTESDDTLLVVANRVNANRLIHYTVWNRNGQLAFSGNLTLKPRAEWSASMRDLITPRDAATKGLLTVDKVYRGFVTIDVVTDVTTLSPTNPNYPFSMANDLEGFVYFTRLAKGSANGLSMVPLEAFTDGSVTHTGFYRAGDRRERISDIPRRCAREFIIHQSCPVVARDKISSLDNRMFGSTPLNGNTRVVVFMWNPRQNSAGPTDYCTQQPHDVACEGRDTSYLMTIYREDGSVLDTSFRLLLHVVDVFELPSPVSGRVRIQDIADYDQLPYTFSFNSAFPGSDPSLSWDAVFEGYIVP